MLDAAINLQDLWEIALLSASLLGLCLAGYAVVYLFFLPMDRVRTLEQVGFAHVSGRGSRRRSWINRLRRWRKVGRTPPPFPNGWFVVAESRQLKPGDLKFVSALGLQLAVFRGRDSKKAYVTDAYCPHLGADITVGGEVRGDCVQCPFHKWSFRGEDGSCHEVPYLKDAKDVPEFIKLKTHTSLEANGLVYFWHHVDGEGPTWSPIVVPELKDGWVYQGRNEFEIACHIQDIPENGADVNHLPAVHKTSIVTGGEPAAWLEQASNLLTWHDWSIRWEQGRCEDGRGHLADLTLQHSVKLNLLGKQLQCLTTDVSATQIGPGLVHLFFDVHGMGRGVMLQYVLPLEENLQRLVHVFYTQKSFPQPLAKLVLYGKVKKFLYHSEVFLFGYVPISSDMFETIMRSPLRERMKSVC